jgi:hypothetical protein
MITTVSFVLWLFYENAIRTSVNSVLALLRRLVTYYVTEISDAQAASIFKVEVLS